MKWGILTFFWIIILIASVLAVVNTKYQTRLMFTEIQRLESQLDHYEVEWGQLQLELTTLTEQGLLENVAWHKQGLVMPKRKKIHYIKP